MRERMASMYYVPRKVVECMYDPTNETKAMSYQVKLAHSS